MTAKKTILLLPLMLLLLVGLASATVTIITPATGASLSGNYNITFNITEHFNVTECNFSMVSSSTANSSTVWAYSNTTDINISAETTLTLGPIDTTIYEDAADYVVTISCLNISGDAYDNGSSSAVIVDNTVPTEPSARWPTTGVYYRKNQSVTLQATIVDAETTGTSVNWRDSTPTGQKVNTMTCSGTTCTLALTGIPDGDFYWSVTASDGTNTTTSNYIHFIVDYQGATGAAKYLLYSDTEQQASSQGMSPALKVGLIALGVYALVQWNNKKKKRK